MSVKRITISLRCSAAVYKLKAVLASAQRLHQHCVKSFGAGNKYIQSLCMMATKKRASDDAPLRDEDHNKRARYEFRHYSGKYWNIEIVGACYQ